MESICAYKYHRCYRMVDIYISHVLAIYSQFPDNDALPMNILRVDLVGLASENLIAGVLHLYALIWGRILLFVRRLTRSIGEV